MKLTSREQEKLMIVVAADLARRRQNRGLKLNYPEAIAILTYEVLEGARDGKSVSELMQYGKHILSREDVKYNNSRTKVYCIFNFFCFCFEYYYYY